MRKHLTRAQAWEHVAKKLLTKKGIKDGLCMELEYLFEDWKISETTFLAMDRQLEGHVDEWRSTSTDPLGGYVYTAWSGPAGVVLEIGRGRFHEERAMACLWMALEALDETP